MLQKHFRPLSVQTRGPRRDRAGASAAQLTRSSRSRRAPSTSTRCSTGARSARSAGEAGGGGGEQRPGRRAQAAASAASALEQQRSRCSARVRVSTGAGSEPAPGTLSGELLLLVPRGCGAWLKRSHGPARTAAAWPTAQRQTAKAVYKSKRGRNHVPRRRHTNLVVAATTHAANGHAAQCVVEVVCSLGGGAHAPSSTRFVLKTFSHTLITLAFSP